MRRRIAWACAVIAAVVVAACGGGSGSSGGGGNIKVAYQLYGGGTQIDQWMKQAKAQFEKANPGSTVTLLPIQSAENDYYTKLDIMQRSASTAPDVMYEDTFLINSDVKAGYLSPLDSRLSGWSDWGQFYDTAKSAAKGADGKIYGVPIGTDTRALWYNKSILQKAGISVPWQPKSWNDILAAAQAIKQKEPDVTPLNVYSGTPAGEASTMQGFEMLLYGTQNPGTLYNSKSNKWIAPSSGFQSALQFLQKVYQQGLALTPQQALDPNIGNIVAQQLLPAGKLAIDLDGSWQSGSWLTTGPKPWPQWSDTMAVASMPTETGQSPGQVSMSGGWTLSVSSKSKASDTAWKFITTALNKDNALSYDVAGSQIAVRKDVAGDSKYLQSNPTVKQFTDLVQYTHYRPAYPEYPQISNVIQQEMEAVMTGQAPPAKASQDYADKIKSIVGAAKVVPAGS